MDRQTLLENICYTQLVYQRINKKLQLDLKPAAIETLIREVIASSDEITKSGKNYYVSNFERGVRVTINAGNYRVITVDRLKK